MLKPSDSISHRPKRKITRTKIYGIDMQDVDEDAQNNNSCSSTDDNEDDSAPNQEDINVQDNHKCYICKKSFKMVGCLKNHLENVHGINECHHCAICNRDFETYRKLKNHNIIVHPKERLQCVDCGFKTRSKWELKIHMYRFHVTLKEYKCTYCSNEYRELFI